MNEEEIKKSVTPRFNRNLINQNESEEQFMIRNAMEDIHDERGAASNFSGVELANRM